MPNLTDVVLTKKAFICKEDFTVNSVLLFLRFTIRRRSPSKVLYLVLFLADNQRSSPQNSKAFIPTLKAVQYCSLTKTITLKLTNKHAIHNSSICECP